MVLFVAGIAVIAAMAFWDVFSTGAPAFSAFGRTEVIGAAGIAVLYLMMLFVMVSVQLAFPGRVYKALKGNEVQEAD